MSQRQPVYRRPSWAQNDASYKIYMRKDLAADRSPGQDFGLENFSYDPLHLEKWRAPEALAKRLPDRFHDAVMDWGFAGAAVCTALERIKKLDDESIYRAYPDKTQSPLHLARKDTNASPSVFCADTPPMSTPELPAVVMPPRLLSIDKMSLEGLPQRQLVDLDSPPLTPLDSRACPTPNTPNPDNGCVSPPAFPEAHQPAYQLFPIVPMSRGESMSSSTSNSHPEPTTTFDENAWEYFLNTYKANLEDVRHNAWARFRGCGYIIDRMRVELSQDQDNQLVLDDFNKWWAEMKPRVHEYEERVVELREPSLELIKMERMSQGLPV